MAFLFLISVDHVQAQWETGGNAFTAGSCVKARFGTTNNTCDVQFISDSIERMRLTKDGFFGIGTTTPLRTFHVNGNIRFENLQTSTDTTAIMLDASGDLSTRSLSISNWNAAFSWGNHAGLYRPVSWVPDWTDVTNKPNFATVATTGSYTDLDDTPYLDSANWNTAYSWGNHVTVGYLTEETDPVWINDSTNYYTKSMLADAGQSEVHYGNLTNVPDIQWENLEGEPPDLSIFSNDNIGYISEYQEILLNEVNEALELSNNGGSVLLKDINYWSKNDADDLYYAEGKVGVGLDAPRSKFHVHSNALLPDIPSNEVPSDISIKSGDADDDKGGIISHGKTKSVSAIRLTNYKTGKTPEDGLLIKMYNKDASITNREDGSLSFQNNGSLLVKLEQTDNLSITGGNLAMNNNQIRFRGSGDQNHRINYTNENGLDGLHIQGNKGVEIATTNQYGTARTVMTVKDENVGIGTEDPETSLEVHHGTLRVSGGQSFGQDYARFVVDPGGSYEHRLMELRNDQQGEIMVVNGNGKVGIGINTPDYTLDIDGNSRISNDLKVCQNVFADELIATAPDWCDFVFDEEYELMSIDSLKRFIETNKHLPDIQKGELIEQNGLKLKEMNQKMMQKIEELTLYIIKLEDRIDQLENK
jgi:hypothetical protein